MNTANLSRSQVEEGFSIINSGRSRWLISINEWLEEPAKIHPQLGFVEVLILHFSDIKMLSQVTDKEKRMSADDLLRMKDFINLAKELNVDLYVHCTAGICRSGAVVEVLKLMGWKVDDEVAEKRTPNSFVLTHLRKAMGFSHSWE